ncbi:MAG TPA: 8-oxoguanine DNA glycosylase [Lachnospiraceae bacterium]|nr:8-oxoguanine DNA glycosylase [Lachnospiraceae bacterium]
MVRKQIDNFSLEQICLSGQCFRMKQEDGEENRYSLIAGDKYLEIEQQGNVCRFYCDEETFEHFWKDYFDLEREYADCIGRINPRDTYLADAASFGAGIRILRQDLWEMIVTFLISQQNNIVRIRRCIQNICEAYGEERTDGRGRLYYGFPKPEALARLDEDALKACNLGYRSKYVVRAARSVVSGEIDLEAVRRMSYKKAREELLKLFGVGEKVADCICLFALHHLQAFPMDTHMIQALNAHYKRGFPNRRYKDIKGIMQQYIFYFELFGKK